MEPDDTPILIVRNCWRITGRGHVCEVEFASPGVRVGRGDNVVLVTPDGRRIATSVVRSEFVYRGDAGDGVAVQFDPADVPEPLLPGTKVFRSAQS